MEPQWNPMAEEQALDRVHRIGQSRPVTAIRYIVIESVEEVRDLFHLLRSVTLLTAHVPCGCSTWCLCRKRSWI